MTPATVLRFRRWFLGPPSILVLLLIASGWLRLEGMQWCIEANPVFTHSIHSDEARKIDDTLNMQPSLRGLRPTPWLQGKGTLLPTLGVLSYAAVARTTMAGCFERVFHVPVDSPAGRYLLLRSISVVASLLLIGIVYRLAVRLSGSGYAGALAAFLFSTSFAAAFSAVIYKADMLVSMLIGLLLLAQLGYTAKPSHGRAMWMGVLLGASTAAKYHGALALVVPVLAIALAPLSARRERLVHLLACGLCALGALFVLAPYMFIDFAVFVTAVENLARYTATRTYQFEGFGPQPLAIITHLFIPGHGLVLTLVALAGVGAAVLRLRWSAEWPRLGPGLGHIVVHFIALSLNAWLVVRYTLPLLPLLTALAGVATWNLLARLIARRTAMARAGVGAVFVLLAVQAGSFLAFHRLITEPVPTVRAANWLRENVPPSSRILEIRRREPTVYGFSETPPRRLTAIEVDEMIQEGQRLGGMQVDLIVVTETCFRDFFRLADGAYSLQRSFYGDLFDRSRFDLLHRFETPAAFGGVKLDKGFLPQDLVIVAPDTYVFRRLGGGGSDRLRLDGGARSARQRSRRGMAVRSARSGPAAAVRGRRATLVHVATALTPRGPR